mmetsp:Transcript_9797/g.33699  ORF Transcript_9797/g.33699 Transcript_9797/m.33699 type:complete len:115 (+) Transcript_9797:656-1000(+)
MTVALCGVLQTLCGVFQLAKLVKLISKPCMIGFMNGLGIVIFMAQRAARARVDAARAPARRRTMRPVPHDRSSTTDGRSSDASAAGSNHSQTSTNSSSMPGKPDRLNESRQPRS